MRIAVLTGLIAALAATLPAAAQTVTAIETEGQVTAVVQTPRGNFIETERGTFRLTAEGCGTVLCAVADVIRGVQEPAPELGLPDGKVATASDGDIVRAWYAGPTDEYAHGVLGDAIEAKSLVVMLSERNADGSITFAETNVGDGHVFEDITPRITDIDGDGRNEVITIRASRAGGAGVVVYGMRNGSLEGLASSLENGRTNRWLNIAGVIGNTIHFVRTPHIGGRWSTLTLNADGSFDRRDDIRTGLSNHVIGSRELDLAEAYLADGKQSLFIPSQDRRTLVDVLDARPDIALPGAIDKAVIGVGPLIVTATEDGQLLAIDPG